MLKELLANKMQEVKPQKSWMEVSKMDEKKEYYPSISLDSNTLPEIKDWEVGEDYIIVLKVTQTSMDMYENDKEERTNARFDIKEIGVLESDSEESKEDSEEDSKSKLKDKLMKKYGQSSS